MIIETAKIKRARYLNSSRTLIYTEIEAEDGTVSKLTFQAPLGNELGVNPLFDKIAKEVTLEKMSEDFRKVELDIHRRKQYEKQRYQSALERKKMSELLEKKAQAFENPIVENLNSRVLRTAIRKAKNEQQIQSLIIAGLVNYIVDNKLKLEDTIAMINGEEINIPAETHTPFDKNTIQETTDDQNNTE